MIVRKNFLFFIPFLGLILVALGMAQQRPVAAGPSDQLSAPKLCDKVYLPLIIDQAAAAKGDVGEGLAPPPQSQGAVECQSFTDFDGDGYDDLAAGSPFEDVSTIGNAGSINVIDGSQNGLTADGDQIISRPTAGATYLAEMNDNLGERLAAGDFNGDGYMDLVAGMPDSAIDGHADAGSVQVFYGSATGLQNPTSQHVFSQAGPIDGLVEDNDQFGYAITAGDFNGDGYDDLAVGSPTESVDSTNNAGAVNIIFGSEDGLTEAGDQQWIEDDFGLFGVSQEGDQFGYALAAADFDKDGYMDLAIGIPFQQLGMGTAINDAGIVFIMPGSSTGPTTNGFQIWSQARSDVAGIEEDGDRFGEVLHTGDFNGDGYGDLAIGLPFEDVGSVSDAGAVNILYGSANGLDAVGNQIIDPDNSSFGAALSAGDDYRFGGALTAGDYNGDGYSDLAIGIPRQNLGITPNVIDAAGAAIIVPGGQSGLNTSNYQFLAQNNNMIEGTAEASDWFGFALTTGDYNGDGYADLGVGVPFDEDNVNSTFNAGNVAVFYGYEGGVLTESNELWNQGTSQIEGLLESGDSFGYGLP